MPRIERRLFEAVVLVLAGCHSTDIRQPPVAPPAPRPLEPPLPPEKWPPASITADGNPDAFCAAYARTHAVDPSKARTLPYEKTSPYNDVTGSAQWDRVRDVVRCRITRNAANTTVEITHTPRCCETKRGPDECPRPQQLTLDGVKFLVEDVSLHRDGSIDGATSLTWYARPNEPPVDHYCGRRPEGLRIDGDEPGDDIGAQLAAMAELEAASVPAFERLAHELASHGAPARLVRRAKAAARDEIRHARTMTELAAAHGAAPRTIEVPPLPLRSLAEIAHENAIEGCVRETYGALVATHQAACAAPEFRDAFAAIAADERRHAALAETVHTWIAERLDGAERHALDKTRRTAQVELRGKLGRASFGGSYAALGIPAPATATALFDTFFA